MDPRRALLLLTTLGGAVISMQGQNVPAVQQGEALQRQREAQRVLRDLQSSGEEEAPAITPDEAFDVGPQYILRSRERRKWVHLNLDSQLSWTDNMFFNERDVVKPVSSTLLTSSAQLSLTPPGWKVGSGRTRPRVGYQHVWMNYALLGAKDDPNTAFPKNDNDFDLANVFADLSHGIGGWQFQLGFDWQRLLNHQPDYGAYGEFYRSYSPRWSIGRVFSLTDRQSLLASYLGSVHFTRVDPTPGMEDTDRNDRTEHNMLIGYSYAITPRFAVQPMYRFQLANYAEQDRTDQVHGFAGSLTFLVTPWLFVRGHGAYELRESDEVTTPDYRKFDAGVSVGVSFSF